jgi:hypothetical protein
MEPKLKAFPIVAANEAKSNPYPYVYVNEDGSVRELHPTERAELETPFSPLDGNRPYVKHSYDQKDGRKSLAGYCRRFAIPGRFHILPAPQEDPAITARQKQAARMIQYAREHGFEYVENADGTVTIKRPKPQEK